VKLLLPLALAALAGCGGGKDPKRADTPLNTEPANVTSVEKFVAAAPMKSNIPTAIPVATGLPSGPAALEAATSEEPNFAVEDENGVKAAQFRLSSVRGRGYPELKVVLSARRIGDTAPAAPVPPVCPEARKCEYSLSRSYTVTLTDDKELQLVARGDAVAIVARTLAVDTPTTIEVLFSADGRLISKRVISLLD
jgi:hypothetical protein